MSTKYTTLEGTEPAPDAEHEPRTILRTEHSELMFMMTEIEDGVFVQWGTCRSCDKQIHLCKCKTGPVMADYIKRWRDERFEKSLRHRKPSELRAIEKTAGINLDGAIDAVKAAAEQGVEPFDPDTYVPFDATDGEKQDLLEALDELDPQDEVCQMCHEAIEQDLDDTWIHSASGEPECWTGDGSVALPVEAKE